MKTDLCTKIKKARIVVFLFLAFCLVFCTPSFAAELSLNLIAVNASESSPKEIDIKYYLPKELGPNDVTDAGSLKVEYDVDKSAYFVSGKVQFNPKESKTFKIRVNDVWVIPQTQIDDLKKQLDANVDLLKKDPSFPIVQQARDKINERLDYILAQQKTYSENIDRRIEQYRAYVDQLKQIEDNIYSLESLKTEAAAIMENDESKTIKLVLEVGNPSKTAEKKVQEKHFLPEEVRSEQVLDAQGFDVRFDEKKGKAYLSKETVFKPGEQKTYNIVIKDIWWFPETKVDSIDKRADAAMKELKGSVFDDRGQILFEDLTAKTQLIKDSQLPSLPIKEHIGIFRVNEKRFDVAKDDVEKLEQMVAVLKLKRLEEIESKQVKNVLQKLQALRGIAAISDALFKKKIPVTITWKIILGTLGFVGFFTAMHFFVWMGRSKKMGEELATSKEGIKEVPKPGQTPAAS